MRTTPSGRTSAAWIPHLATAVLLLAAGIASGSRVLTTSDPSRGVQKSELGITSAASVTEVSYRASEGKWGEFRQTSYDGDWEEVSVDGQGFWFRETGRDEWSIYLDAADRPGVSIQLDLWRRKVVYRDLSNRNGVDLYTIELAVEGPIVDPLANFRRQSGLKCDQRHYRRVEPDYEPGHGKYLQYDGHWFEDIDAMCGEVCEAAWDRCVAVIADRDSASCKLYSECDTETMKHECDTQILYVHKYRDASSSSHDDDDDDDEDIRPTSDCVKTNEGWTLKPKDDDFVWGSWSEKYDDRGDCFEECQNAGWIVWNQESDKCYCWDDDADIRWERAEREITYDLSQCHI